MVEYKKGDQVIITAVKRIGHRIVIGSTATIANSYGPTGDGLYQVDGVNQYGTSIRQVLSDMDFKPAPKPLRSNEEALRLLEGEVPW